MQKLETEFKFDIGEVVGFKPMTGEKVLIVEHVAVRCTGGVQNYYTVRSFRDETLHAGVSERYVRFHEIELVSLKEK